LNIIDGYVHIGAFRFVSLKKKNLAKKEKIKEKGKKNRRVRWVLNCCWIL